MAWNLAALPLNIDPQQILLHLLNFVILFAGLWLLLYKPVRNFMKKRKEYYEQMEESAKEKEREAEEKRSAYEQKLAEADHEIEEKRAAVRQELENYELKRKQAAEEQAAAVLSEAHKRAAEDREYTVRAARKEISALVADATEKLALNKSTSEMYDQFLDKAERGDDAGGKA